MWDQSQYLESSVMLYQALSKKGLVSLLTAFSNMMDTKTPLITILPIPFYLIFGNNYESALCVNLIFLILSSVYLYKLTNLLSNEKAVLFSVFIYRLFVY